MKFIKEYYSYDPTHKGSYNVNLSLLKDVLNDISDNYNFEVIINPDFNNFVKINSSNYDNTIYKTAIESTIKQSLQYYYTETQIKLFANINRLNSDYFYSDSYRDDAGKIFTVDKNSIISKTLYVYFNSIYSQDRGFTSKGNGYNDIIINI